jgi:hypothetical protein
LLFAKTCGCVGKPTKGKQVANQKLHPAEVAGHDTYRNAVKFEVALFLGSGAYNRASASSINEAVLTAGKMMLNYKGTRTPMIYAIDSRGVSTLVTKDMIMNGNSSQTETPPNQQKPKPEKDKATRADIEGAVAQGHLPPVPDFSAETHKRFRPRLAHLVELAQAGDIAGLKAVEIKPTSSSPKALAKYRDRCISAIEAQKVKNSEPND